MSVIKGSVSAVSALNNVTESPNPSAKAPLNSEDASEEASIGVIDSESCNTHVVLQEGVVLDASEFKLKF